MANERYDLLEIWQQLFSFAFPAKLCKWSSWFFLPTIRTTRQNKPTTALETKKSAPILFNDNEAFDAGVNTVYGDRPMSDYEGTFF